MIRHQLHNGLRTVMEHVPSTRSVSLGIWIKTGSRSENSQNNGISHFLEHMLFKGTDRLTAKDIAEAFDAIGGNVNAFTSKEYTCFYAKVLDIHLQKAVDVLADMFFHSQLDENELEKEKNVILEEIAMYEDTPDDLVHDLIARAAYGDHPLGYPVLGTEETLSSMGSGDLKEYMRRHYNVENTVISLAGNVDERSLELIENVFGSFDNHGEEMSVLPPAYLGEIVFHHKKTEQNHICIAIPGCPLGDSRLYPMILLNNCIGGGMSSRLFQEIREKRGLAYSVYSYHSAHLDSGLLTIYIGTAPKQTEEVLKVTRELLHELVDKGLTETELNKSKDQLKGSLILSLESTSSRMNRLGKNELMLKRHFSVEETVEQIDSVTLDDIRSLMDDVFQHPFALSMVGLSDQPLHHFRRDPLAVSRTN